MALLNRPEESAACTSLVSSKVHQAINSFVRSGAGSACTVKVALGLFELWRLALGNLKLNYHAVGSEDAKNVGLVNLDLRRPASAAGKADDPDAVHLEVFARVKNYCRQRVQADLRLVLFGVLALVIVVAALIAFGPNVPKLIPTVAI